MLFFFVYLSFETYKSSTVLQYELETFPKYSGDGWRPACKQQVINKFLILLSLCMQFFLSLLNCFYLNIQKLSYMYM